MRKLFIKITVLVSYSEHDNVWEIYGSLDLSENFLWLSC